MSDGFAYGDIIVIAAIAAFIILRYRSVLGEKRGHDFTAPSNTEKSSNAPTQAKIIQLNDTLAEEIVEKREDKALDALEDSSIRRTLEEATEIDPSFTLDAFIGGAREAFDMVLAAYNEADRETLKMLLSKELFRSFDEEMKQAEKSDSKTYTTLVSVKSTDLVGAELSGSKLKLEVSFLSEQIHVEKDADGKIVGGDASRVEEVADEWVLERDLKSRNPNWAITDM